MWIFCWDSSDRDIVKEVNLSYWSSRHGTQPQGGYQEELDIPAGEPHGRWSSGLSDISLHYHREYEGRSGDTENTERQGHPATVHRTEEGAQGLPDPVRRTQRMSHGVHSGQSRKLCMNVNHVLTLLWNCQWMCSIPMVHLLKLLAYT